MIIKTAKEVIETELKALIKLKDNIGDEFKEAVKLILGCTGKVIVSGMGKSGNIGRKIAATFSSTGTPSFFLHPAEAKHGDLGMISENDIYIAISFSGETEEFSSILPAIKRLGIPLIAVTGNSESTLAKFSECIIEVPIEKEACPLGLAPTASTTATLALGDALAVAVLKEKGFSEKDFAFLHPGGSLGKKTLTRVADLMHIGDEIPIVKESDTLRQSIIVLAEKRFGIVAVTDSENRLSAVFSNGDLSRVLEKYETPPINEPISRFSTYNPKTIDKDALAAKALKVMQDYKITALLILNQDNFIEGIIHMHDIIGFGIG